MNQMMTKFVKYDPSKSEITLKLLFVNESLVVKILELIGQTVKLTFAASRYKESIKDGTRRRWYQLITRVLQSKDIPIDGDVLGAFHESMKESFFDCQKFVIDNKEIVVVPSINAVPDEEVRRACEAIIARYSQIGVDFSDII